MRRLVAPRNLENRFHGDYAVAVPYLGAPNSAIRALFKDELGVLFLNRPGKKNKRSYVSMRIPASVAKRVRPAPSVRPAKRGTFIRRFSPVKQRDRDGIEAMGLSKSSRFREIIDNKDGKSIPMRIGKHEHFRPYRL